MRGWREKSPQHSLQVDTVVVEMCLLGNRMCSVMPVPICSSCVASFTPGSRLW